MPARYIIQDASSCPAACEWAVYILVHTPDQVSSRRCSYVGSTNNLTRRLRQHNGELVGGAKFTSGTLRRRGGTWKRAAAITGLPDHRAALQFEWMLKHLTLKQPRRLDPTRRRLRALAQLLDRDRPTSTAEPYHTYPNPLKIFLETKEAQERWGVCPVIGN